MKHIRQLSILLLLFATVTVFAARKPAIAVAEPVAKGGIDVQTVEMLWDMLEASIKTEEYSLISRGALKQILTEAGLANSSGLVNPSSEHLATLGNVKGVKYLLVCTIGKFGTRLNCTLKLIDCSTADIQQNRTANLRCANLDELADKLEHALEKLFQNDKQLKRCALLMPVLQLEAAPANLDQQLHGYMGACLIQNGIPLQNLSNVTSILAQNNLNALHELEPALCKKVGQLLEVEFLIQSTVNSFSLNATTIPIVATGAQVTVYTGNIGGTVKVVETATGRIVAIIPYEMTLDSRLLNPQEVMYWQPEHYYKYMIFTPFGQTVLPELVKALAKP